MKTKGDKILDVPLAKIGDKGLFTKELEVKLLDGSIDLAVHSLKDLETQLPEGLILAAVSKRHDPRDVIIAHEKGVTIETMPQGAVVGTSSLRRASQLKKLRPDFNIVDIRGNVPTRIQKLLNSDWNAILLACAGVERLELTENISSYIEFSEILPAAGQGALGIEIKAENEMALNAIKPLHDEDTFLSVTAERSLLHALEGGCQVPVGVLGKVVENTLILDAYVGSLDGSKSLRKQAIGKKVDAKAIGQELAKELIVDGAADVLKEIRDNL